MHTSRRFTPGKEHPGKDFAGPRTGLEVLEKRLASCHFQE